MGRRGHLAAASNETLARLMADHDALVDFAYPNGGESDPENHVHLCKSFDRLHCLLTGVARGGQPPLSLAVMGGEEFGANIDQGRARVVTSDQVADIAKALEALSVDTLTARYSTLAYPVGGLDSYLEIFREMVVVYRGAAARGDAVIQWIT